MREWRSSAPVPVPVVLNLIVAAASSVLVTFMTAAMGFFLFLGLATVFLM